ncbi:MAG: restriction endonuclease subunit S, partial [Bacteroidota bacterium]|nr:restriction endonuclease subunit S [Bacteroidota bacterium]
MTLKTVKIKELCEFKYGKNLPEHSRIPGKYPVYGSSGRVGTHSTYHVKGPGIIVGRKGTVGAIQWSKDDFFPIDTTYYVVHYPDKVDLRYLYYRLLPAGLETMNSDAAVPGLNRTAAINHRISIFEDLPTQRKIASILSAYDDLIENNLNRIKLLEELAQITYEEWFVRFRIDGEELQIDEETGLPEGWRKVKLKEVCKLIMGQSPKSEFYNETGEGLPFHQGVRKYGFRFPENDTWSTAGSRIAEKGDILFSVRAPVGRLNMAIEKIILGRGLAAIRHKNGYKSFVFYQLQNKFFEEDMMGGGAIFNSVTKNDMERIELVEADPSTMQRIKAILDPINELIENLTKQNQLLKEARDILLPRLMTGMIDVEKITIE